MDYSATLEKLSVSRKRGIVRERKRIDQQHQTKILRKKKKGR
jgi:hypothetical protein